MVIARTPFASWKGRSSDTRKPIMVRPYPPGMAASPEIVVRRAQSAVGHSGFILAETETIDGRGGYSPWFHCEHFALWCKTSSTHDGVLKAHELEHVAATAASIWTGPLAGILDRWVAARNVPEEVIAFSNEAKVAGRHLEKLLPAQLDELSRGYHSKVCNTISWGMYRSSLMLPAEETEIAGLSQFLTQKTKACMQFTQATGSIKEVSRLRDDLRRDLQWLLWSAATEAPSDSTIDRCVLQGARPTVVLFYL
eukprot:SAG22_NODE_665_length_8020_cov_22.612296_5_plen_253_part_00